jgi:hypothetical protein
LFSGAQPGRGGEATAQDRQAIVPDPSLQGNSSEVAPPSGEGYHVPTIGPELGNTRALGVNETHESSTAPSTFTSVLSKAHNFKVGNIQINSPQYVYNTQEKSIDGMVIQCYWNHFAR